MTFAYRMKPSLSRPYPRCSPLFFISSTICPALRSRARACAGAGPPADHDDLYKKLLLDSIPIGRMAKADDVADFVEFLASEKSLFLTGEEILMNGGSSN
jgi:NAD(P)-dependent dehydrogenase (short-subunit alcohol dehydrogenase family)